MEHMKLTQEMFDILHTAKKKAGSCILVLIAINRVAHTGSGRLVMLFAPLYCEFGQLHLAVSLQADPEHNNTTSKETKTS